MDKREILKTRIEEERNKLDQMADMLNSEESYKQSLILDQLIAEYIELTA